MKYYAIPETVLQALLEASHVAFIADVIEVANQEEVVNAWYEHFAECLGNLPRCALMTHKELEEAARDVDLEELVEEQIECLWQDWLLDPENAPRTDDAIND